jgi:CheY-like chemotaxis protein
LHEYEKMLGFLLRDKAVQLRLHVDPRLPDCLHGDSVRLNQILLNLGSNAVKFTETGNITIALELQKESRTDLEIILSISDTGIGIPVEKKKLIFESFEQADASISQKYGGTGLGLSITKRLVALMGGSISVQSEVGRGTTFTVVLPLQKVDKQAARAVAAAGAEQYDLSGLRVLVVEDNRMNALLVSRLLESWRASSVSASHGQEALDLLAHAQFDIILLDLQMPVMDGFQLLDALKGPAVAQPFQTPIIALTADAYEQTREKALAMGCAGFVAKPIVAAALYQTIKAQWEYLPE